MPNPNMTTQVTETDWVDNVERLKSIQAAGIIQNPLFYMPLLNGLAMIRGAGSLEFSRPDDSATLINRYGVVQKGILADQPRFEKEGLLVEKASNNIQIWSEEFDQVSWGKTGTSIAPNDIIAPDGTTTADKLIEDSNPATAHVVIDNTVATVNSDWAGSVFAKADERHILRMNVWDASAASNSVSAIFDLLTGTVYAAIASGNGVLDPLNPPRIVALADGWFRCSVSGVPNTSGTSVGIALYMQDALEGGSSYDGDGSSGLHLWGAQLENQTFATSYIPTTTGTILRNGDRLTVDLEGNLGLQSDQGTFIVDADLIGLNRSASTQQRIFSVGGETYRIIAAGLSVTSFPQFRWGDAVAVPNLSSREMDVLYRWGLTHNGGIVTGYLDGISFGSGDNTNYDAVGTTIQIGHAGGHELNGHISNFRFYDRELTAREMALA